MRIQEEYKKSGYFWLPSNEEHKIPGTLTIKDGGDVELEVVGLLDESIEAFNGNEDLSRIIGNVEKDGLVTLDNCFYKKKNITFGGISKSIVHANMVLSGAAYEQEETFSFNSLSFSIEGLNEWVGISGITVEPDRKNRSTNISYVHPEDIVINLKNDMKLMICFAANVPFGPSTTGIEITRKTYFKLISDTTKDLSYFTSIAYKLVNLLGFAIDTTVCLFDLHATSDELMHDLGNGKTRPIPIKIYYPSIPFSKKVTDIDRYNMIFGYGYIKDNAETVFNNWLSEYDSIAPALGLYFSTQTDDHRYLDGKFLALAQGLETYHRRISNDKLMDDSEFNDLVEQLVDSCPEDRKEWLQGRLMHGNEINFGKRIKSIIEPFKKLIGTSSERSKIIRQIVEKRNYLTHYDENLKSSAPGGIDLYPLYLKMEAFFQLHFLQLLGFSKTEIAKVIENCPPLGRKLKK